MPEQPDDMPTFWGFPKAARTQKFRYLRTVYGEYYWLDSVGWIETTAEWETKKKKDSPGAVVLPATVEVVRFSSISLCACVCVRLFVWLM